MAFAVVAMPLEVFAQNTNLGVSIIQLSPNTGTGTVGSHVTLQGTIYQANGTYQVILGKVVVDSGKAQGYYVNSNFTIPELPSGSYSLILRDFSVNVNASQSFSVSTAYLISPSQTSIPRRSQRKLNRQRNGRSNRNFIWRKRRGCFPESTWLNLHKNRQSGNP